MAHVPDWVVKYHRIPYSELNCWELVSRILWQERSITLPTYADEYERDAEDPDWEFRLSEQVHLITEREKLEWPRFEHPQPFDVALYWVLTKNREGETYRSLSHVGLVIDHRLGISTDSKHGSHLYKLASPIWADRLEGYYRHAALA